MNALAFANSVIDFEFRRKEFQEHPDVPHAHAVVASVTASKAAYNTAVPLPAIPAGAFMQALQTLQATVDNGFAGLTNRLAVVDGRLTTIEGRLTAVEDRLTDVEDRLTMVEEKVTAIDSRLSELDARSKQDRIIAFNRYYRAAGTADSPWDLVPFNDGQLPTQAGLPALDTQEAVNGFSQDQVRRYEDGYGLSHLGQFPARRRKLARFIGGELR